MTTYKSLHLPLLKLILITAFKSRFENIISDNSNIKSKLKPQNPMKIKILLVCLLATTLFNGCKKDEETTTTTTTPTAKTDLLCGKNWMLTAYTINPAYDFFHTGTPVTDLMGSMQPCLYNNITTYSTNLSYVVDEGATKCSGSAPQTYETGTWAFASSESHLVVSRTGGSSLDYSIATLNSTTLQLTQPYVVSGTTYTITSTYTKQ